MFSKNKKKDTWSIANDIAKEIGLRGFPAEAKLIAAMSAIGDIQKSVIVVPERGIAAINNDLSIVVVSPNRPLPQAPVFEYENAEAAAENILRNLPLS